MISFNDIDQLLSVSIILMYEQLLAERSDSVVGDLLNSCNNIVDQL